MMALHSTIRNYGMHSLREEGGGPGLVQQALQPVVTRGRCRSRYGVGSVSTACRPDRGLLVMDWIKGCWWLRSVPGRRSQLRPPVHMVTVGRPDSRRPDPRSSMQGAALCQPRSFGVSSPSRESSARRGPSRIECSQDSLRPGP